MNYQGKSFMLFSFWSCEFFILFYYYYFYFYVSPSHLGFFLLLFSSSSSSSSFFFFFWWLSISLFANYNIEKNLLSQVIYTIFVSNLFMLCLFQSFLCSVCMWIMWWTVPVNWIPSLRQYFWPSLCMSVYQIKTK